MATKEGNDVIIQGINDEIAARKELAKSLAGKEALDAQKKYAEEWKRTNERIGDQLTDALMRGFESGKSFAENFRDTVKNMFKTLILQPIIQPIMTQVAGGVQNALGMGQQGSARGGGISTDMFGGSNGSLAKGVGWLGEKFGSNAVSSFATGLGMTSYSMAAGATAAVPSLSGLTMGSGMAASMGSGAAGTVGAGLNTGAMAAGSAAMSYLPYVGALFAASQGQYATAAGTAIGTAILPGIGTAVGAVAGMLIDSFGDSAPKTRHSQRTTAELASGAFSVTERDDRVAAGADAAVLAMTRDSVAAANKIFELAGVDAAIESFTATMESSVLGDRNGVLSGGKLRMNGQLIDIGLPAGSSTTGGFGGWSSEDMAARLATDVQLSILEAFQQADILSSILGGVNVRGLSAEAAQQLTSTVQAVVQSADQFRVAMEKLPFENLRNLTLDARANLISFAGGLENLLGAQQAYYDAFYSEEERLTQARKGISEALSGVSLTIPQTLVQYRALVDSLDLNTEAGQKAYTTLMSLAPAFAQVTGQAQKAATEMASTLIAGLTGRDGIDIGGLVAALSDASEQTFVAAMERVFTSLADRIGSIVDGIANERLAIQQAIREVLGIDVMTPDAILRQIAGVNTALPSNAGVVVAANQLNAADSAAATAARQRDLLAGQVSAANQTYQASLSGASQTQAQLDAARARLAAAQGNADLEPYVRSPGFGEDTGIGGGLLEWTRRRRRRQAAQDELDAAQAQLAQAEQAARAAQAAAAASPALGRVQELQAQYATAVTQAAKAQSAATAAAESARASQTAYADSLQKFALEAGKSVGKLGELREETLRYYEAQKQLADLMKSSAESLRKTATDYRFSQLDPEDQFTQLQRDFGQAYSMALSTDGETLAGYADKLNGLINPMLTAAQDMFASDAQYNSFVAQTLARVDSIAGRLDVLAPANYEAASLDVLNQIDATLVALQDSALSADRILVDAINAGRDATVNGLRQIANALTGGSVAAFASGGFHTGGLRIVGENGPELEATGPSRIFSSSQTRAILAGGGNGNAEMVAELRALRAEVGDLRIEARATAITNAKMARSLESFERGGMGIYAQDDEPLITTGELV